MVGRNSETGNGKGMWRMTEGEDHMDIDRGTVRKYGSTATGSMRGVSNLVRAAL